MWFRFPLGAERITIERQAFSSEFVDEAGRHYFRAPGHFAPTVLALAGFDVVENLPEGMPADLPREDPERDKAIAGLTASLTALRDDIAGLQSDRIAAQQALTAAQHENTMLKAELAKANATIADLQDDLEDAGKMPPPAPTNGTGASKKA
jgi:hypothetical protein